MKSSLNIQSANKEVSLIDLLGGSNIIRQQMLSDIDIINLSAEGITKASLETVISHLGISKKAFSENMLDTSVKTLERKKSTDKLNRYTSSLVIEIAKVIEHAYAVFEDGDKVKSWFSTPNKALNGLKPLDIFYLPTGLKMVNDILGRIEYGVFS